MKKCILSAMCLLFLLSVRAQVAAQSDETYGVINTYLAGLKIIREQYGFEVERDGELRAFGVLTYVEGQEVISAIRATESKPLHFGASITRTEILAAQFEGPTLLLRVANEPNRQRATQARVVLENYHWYQYILLLRQYERTKGGRQKFFCLIPSRALEFELSIELADTPVYEIHDRAVQTRRYRIISANNLAIDLWTDEASRLLLVTVEAQQVKAIQEGAEALAEVILKAHSKPISRRP